MEATTAHDGSVGSSPDPVAGLVGVVNEIVGADRRPVTPESRLFADLALDSFDLLELIGAVEDRTGLAFSLGDVASWVQGDLHEADFVGPDGRLTEAGWIQARRVMPQLPDDLPAEQRYPLNVVGHFSVR